MARHEVGASIAKQLKNVRRSQAWLAGQLGVDRSTVNKWLGEDGNRISAYNLGRVCDCLSIDKRHLFELAQQVWPKNKPEYQHYLEANQSTTPIQEADAASEFQLPYIADPKSKDCPIYFELNLGKEEPVTLSTDKREKPIFEFPLMWTERAEDWRKHFVETRAHILLTDWLNQPGIHPILGEPGGGKSTLLRYWAHKLTELSTPTKRYVPLLIPLREVDASGINGFFENQNKQYGRHFDVNDYLGGKTPEGVQPVWLFDGLDELPKAQRNTWKEHIKRQSKHCCLVTCRTALWDSDYRIAFGEPHYLMGLYPPDQKRFLCELAQEWREGERQVTGFEAADDQWVAELHGKLQDHPNLRQISGSPLLLTLIARTNAPGKINLPAKRVTFYQNAFRELLKQRESDEINAWPFIGVLSQLAYEVSQTEMQAEFSRTLFEKHSASLSCKQQETLRNSDLLKFSDDGNCQWLHQTFQGWLLAEYLHENGGLCRAVETYWTDPNYQEVLALLWGLSDEAAQLQASHYLIHQGCQADPQNPNKRHSGLRTLLSLVHRSGENPAPAVLDVLWENTNTSAYRKEAIAINETTPPQILELLTRDDDFIVRWGLAQNPNIPPTTQRLWATDDDRTVRWSLANNPVITPATQEILARDDDSDVRRRLAENPVITPATREILAKDNDPDVRRRLAENPVITPATQATQKRLAKGDDSDVTWRLAQNPNITPVTQERLTKDDDLIVRWYLAENPNITLATQEVLAKDDDPDVRWRLALNPNITPAAQKLLAKDEDLIVRWGLARNPNACLEWF